MTLRRTVYVLMLSLSIVACAPKPPDIATRPPDVQRAFVAKDLLDQIKVLSDTVIMMNASHKLSDQDTGYVRDFVLVSVTAVEAYVPGGTVYATLRALQDAMNTLTTRMSANGQAAPDLSGLLRILQAAINGFAPPNPFLEVSYGR